MTLAPGTRIGPSEITGSLGAGGMGEVYRARDARLGRSVAIKILPEPWLVDSERRARFDREARVLASLNHPHIGALFGLEEESGRRALVLELIEGPTLATRLARGPLSVGEALELGVQIASALEAAHERGVVHRDLKPANVLLTGAPPKAKVVDFGLAKETSRQVAAADPESQTFTLGATQVGVVMGTAAYMSPEQARGDVVDARADMWAFGCVLYEMLTGRSLFVAATLPDTLAAIVSREPDWSLLPAATPPAVVRLLRRCLAKDWHERLRDIGDARLLIEDARRDSSPGGVAPAPSAPVPTAPSRSSRRSTVALIATSILLGAIAGWLVRAGRQAQSIADERSSTVSELRLEINTPATTDPLSLAISPDGRRLAFVANEQGRPLLWIRSLESGSSEPIAGTANASLPFWSPDGSALGFFAEGQLKRVDLDVKAVRVLAPAHASRGGTWSSEGIIVFQPTLRGGLARVAAQGGPVTSVGTFYARFPHFLPDGRHFLYWDFRGIAAASLDGKLQRHLVDDASAAVYNSGHLFFVAGSTLQAQSFDPSSLAVSGPPFAVAADVGLNFIGTAPLSAAATGPIVYRGGTVGGRRQFVWVGRSGDVLATVGEPLFDSRSPALSPDGRYVVFDSTPGPLWLMDVARGVRSRLDGADGFAAFWSPDGRRIAFSTSDKQVKVVPVSGGDAEVLFRYEQSLTCLDWSADGRLFACHTFFEGDEGQELVIVALDGSPPVQIGGKTSNETDPQFSPDGKWIAYTADDSGGPEVYLQRFDAAAGPRMRISDAGGGMARFRADGKELYYVALDGKLMAVSLEASGDGATLEPGAARALFDAGIGSPVQSNSLQQYMVARDGDRFLMNRLVEEVPPPVTVIVNWKPRT